MKMSGAMQEQYENCRMRMVNVNKNFKRYMWFQLVIGVLFFVFTMYAGASSTLHEDVKGPAKFYYAMDAGIIQVLLAMASLLFGFMTAMKKRISSYLLLVLYLFMLIYTLTGTHIQLQLGNAALFICGLALNTWIQLVFSEHEMLKGQPGYPHFSVHMEESKEYEAPLYVTHRKQPEHMETVGAAPAKHVFRGDVPNPARPHRIAELQETVFSEMTVPERRTAAAAAPKPQIELETLHSTDKRSKARAAEQEKQAFLARQQELEAAMLADMTPETAHHHNEGDVSMLPSAEEVRARMAAMKKARENGEI